MQYTFIVNRSAGKGRGARVGEAIQRYVTRRAFPGRVLFPEDENATRALARAHAGDGNNAVIVVGGDGTVSAVAAAIVAGGARCHIGVVPAGNGNDFWRMSGMPVHVPAVLDALLRAQPTRCDYGRLAWDDGSNSGAGLFLNAAGVGFDALVAEAARSLPFPGLLGYGASAIVQLMRWNAPEVEVWSEALDEPLRLQLLFAYAGNGAYGGGGFRLAPDASVCDGLLDVCVVRELPFLRALWLMPRALRGTHASAPEVTMLRASCLRVRSAMPLPLHADGELLTRKARNVRVEIVSGGISILRPQRAANLDTSAAR